jgi:hypothetical protein
MKKKPISSTTTKKKRTLKSVTVDNWIKNDLARDNAELWLRYTTDLDGNVDALRCALCTGFEDDLKYITNYKLQKVYRPLSILYIYIRRNTINQSEVQIDFRKYTRK